jgi:hypothetical protein
LRNSTTAHLFQHEYRIHSLEAALHARGLKHVIGLFREVGVEPVVIKGWAIARFYPEPGMRPYSDLDLCVQPDQYSKAETLLKDPAATRECVIDLHYGFDKFDDHRCDEILARSELVWLDDVQVRVLSAEDHLRFVCMHLLRHGAVRPPWLCDVAVLLESRPKNFDWDRCLSGSRRQADWVACAIGLAHQLLGARIEGTPIAGRAKNLPKWMVPAVLKEWGIPYSFPGQVAVYLRNLRWWRELLRELPRHWPNPIEATATVGGAFNSLPRMPFQVGHLISRAAALVSAGAWRRSST